MTSCSHCGRDIRDGVRFCTACGAAVQTSNSIEKRKVVDASAVAPMIALGQSETPATLDISREIIPPPPAETGLIFTWTVEHKKPAPRAAQGFWAFREQSTALADSLAAKLQIRKQNQWTRIATRMIQGALMHKDVYRATARSPELNQEALIVAGVLTLAKAIGMVSILALVSGAGVFMLTRVVPARALGWGGAVFAIQMAAKSYKLDLPAATVFRGLIYAQSPLLLMVLPGGFGNLLVFWSAACSLAALRDIAGPRRAGTLAIIGGVVVALVNFFAFR